MNIITRAARAMFGSANERELKRYQQRVPAINALEPEMRKLSDGQLRAKTAEFRARLAQGETLDDLLCEAFAVGREASRRVMGMRHFDVQLIGGMVLHDGKIAEMRTGEGKTLVGTLPVYLNALAGRGVHVVTVNDYLARRDAGEMSRLYEFLGLSTGVIAPSLSDEERRAAYAADITYGTNNEFGFDYLRDNMKYSPEEMVQRDFNFVIVDEVDSILIDEARTPLIISGPAEDSSPLYHQIDVVVRELVQDAETYEKDEKLKSVTLSEKGTENLELLLRGAGLLGKGSLYDMHNVAIVHHAQQSLRAHTLFSRDVDYIVRNGQVILIDEFTGRMMDGRRYSEGLHQALEAKEGVEIQRENQTLASITFQNYFRLYPKLAGMTGTAMTEVDEFMEIYKLHAVAIPTNLPVQRRDADDEVYLTASRKYEAVANLIEEITARKQPVLVGTTSIEKSEILSGILSKRKIPHNVLNARNHEQEARIIAQAGAPGAITIATNMAGRGTDIKLGGNAEMLVAQRIADLAKGRDDGAVSEEEALAVKKAIQEQVSRDQKIVQEAGGLYVIGTERHESRRVDNQLRGRSGRQGDPGNSRFFLSLEDDLIRIFGTGRMGGMMQKLGLKEDEAIVHPWLNKALEKAQKKVEARNFDMRKNTLRYDDVMNDQRKEVYAQRREYMAMTDLSGVMEEAAHAVIEDEVHAHIPENSFPEAWDMEGLRERIQSIFVLDLPLGDWASENHIDEEGITERILARVMERHREKMGALEPGFQNMVEKHILLTCFDTGWKEHLHALDQLRQGIGLRAYAQKDPLNEYKQEAFQLFTIMISEMRQSLWHALSTFQPMMRERVGSGHFHMEAEGEAQGLSSDGSGHVAPLTIGFQERVEGVVPRNAPCACGSGRKFKHCHGRMELESSQPQSFSI